MRSVNRVAIVVRPKPAFFDWARSLEGDSLGNPEIWCSAYLVDETDEGDLLTIVNRHFHDVFVEQLGSWITDDTLWPSPRTFEMFQEWFEAVVADMVLDLSENAITHDG